MYARTKTLPLNLPKSPSLFSIIIQAYEVLNDETKRRDYDS